MGIQHNYDGWSYERLRQQRNRAHFLLEDPYRFVTVLLHRGKLYAIDSPCYHAAGPLGEGEVMDIEDTLTSGKVSCLRCPWHNFLISIETGEEVEVETIMEKEITTTCTSTGGVMDSNRDVLLQDMEMPTYPLRPHWETTNTHHNKNKNSDNKSSEKLRVSRGAIVQRTHNVWLDENSGILTIEVADESEIRKHPVASDKVAGDLKNGALTMQVFDIKLRGLSA